MFEPLDQLFIATIIRNKFAKEIEFYMKKSLEYTFDLNVDNATAKVNNVKATNIKTKKISTKNCLMIGIYDITKKTFIFSPIKDLFYETLIKKNDYFYDSFDTLKKLFSNRNLNIREDYHYIIPYLCSIISPDKFNVVRFYSEGYIGYCLIELNYPLNLKKLNNDLEIYHSFYQVYIKSTSKSTQNVSRAIAIKTPFKKNNSKSHYNTYIKKFISHMARTKLKS